MLKKVPDTSEPLESWTAEPKAEDNNTVKEARGLRHAEAAEKLGTPGGIRAKSSPNEQ